MSKALLAIIPALLAWFTAQEQGELKRAEVTAQMAQTIHLQSQRILDCTE